jgi:hypothetical protein
MAACHHAFAQTGIAEVRIMAEVEAVLAEALADMKAGRSRTMPDYLGLVPNSERAELAELLSIFFMREAAAAGPERVDPERYERALGVLDRLNAAGPIGNLPAALAELRRTRRLRRDDIVSAIAERFGVKGDGRERLRRSYHELETGQLMGRGVSFRLLKALGDILHVDAEDLVAAASRATSVSTSPARAFGRGLGEVEPVRGAREENPPRDATERLIDGLFRGGLDG